MSQNLSSAAVVIGALRVNVSYAMITRVVAAVVFIPLRFRPASLISDIVIRLLENYYTSMIMLLIFLFVYSITVVRAHV